jgi:hypothetical protein
VTMYASPGAANTAAARITIRVRSESLRMVRSAL